MGMIKHPQSTQSNKFAISLQYLKNEVRDGVHFWHAEFLVSSKFLEVGIIVFDGSGRHVQSIQNRKLVIFVMLQYLKKKVSQLLLCSIVMKNIQMFYGVQFYGVTC